MLNQLLERCDKREADLFGSKLTGLEGDHVMGQLLVNRLKMAERMGAIDRGTIERALAEVIAERAESQARAMRGHIMKERGRGVAECMQAINRHMASLPVMDFARDLITNCGRLVVSHKPKPVALDENLLCQ
ncbi:hypothetical protein CKA38_09885 [Ereboglobus luteus]|uniref:Uncharacterized protein n=2 Tax=Ereboglobus luteus TaxID=1796921 RepID=A0A2U8E4R3_9BACT|nr:hypothetical protein CKA38_09885 [Ereboglobus luteus]